MVTLNSQERQVRVGENLEDPAQRDVAIDVGRHEDDVGDVEVSGERAAEHVGLRAELGHRVCERIGPPAVGKKMNPLHAWRRGDDPDRLHQILDSIFA